MIDQASSEEDISMIHEPIYIGTTLTQEAKALLNSKPSHEFIPKIQELLKQKPKNARN